jgi:lipopolysaccharide export system protein LptC
VREAIEFILAAQGKLDAAFAPTSSAMKHWPSQLFPIVMLALLAGLTFWLQSRLPPTMPIHDGKLRHDPGRHRRKLRGRRSMKMVSVKYRLTAPT